MRLGPEKNLQLTVDTTPDNCDTTSATMTNFWQLEIESRESLLRGIGFSPLIEHPVANPL